MPSVEDNRRLLRARDAIDRAYAQPLDVPALARIAFMSEAHFSRSFRAAFGETPHRFKLGLQVSAVELSEEPVERPYGIDFGLRDPFGNGVRITQPIQATQEEIQAGFDAQG